MRKLVLVLVSALFTQFGMQYADACGDKTMRVINGLRRYQPLAKAHPSKVLIYSAALPPGKAVELRDFLNNKVGHKATAMDDLGSVENGLRTSHYDLVLTNLAEASELQKQVESYALQTVVVPVLIKEPKSEVKAAQKQYKVVMDHPTDGYDFMVAVYRAMNSQSRKS